MLTGLSILELLCFAELNSWPTPTYDAYCLFYYSQGCCNAEAQNNAGSSSLLYQAVVIVAVHKTSTLKHSVQWFSEPAGTHTAHVGATRCTNRHRTVSSSWQPTGNKPASQSSSQGLPGHPFSSAKIHSSILRSDTLNQTAVAPKCCCFKHASGAPGALAAVTRLSGLRLRLMPQL
jgi:hypothetical protein